MGNTLQKQGYISQNPQEQEQEQEFQVFTCEICVELMESNKKFTNNNNCVHPFCVDCIAKYIEVKVKDKATDINCPGLSCKQLLDPIFCRPIVSKPVFEKWCDNLCESTALGFHKRCYCPNCKNLVLNECETVKKSNCPKCKRDFCFECKIPWHFGYQCNESEQFRDRNDALFGVLVEHSKWTRCPRCGQTVERVDGCRAIRCRCGIRFCHECGRRVHLGSCGRPYFWIECLSNLLLFLISVMLVFLIYLIFWCL